MISKRHLIQISFTRELGESGLVYALSVLARSLTPSSHRPYEGVRRSAGSAAANLALRRYLVARDVPFAVDAPSQFLDPDRYDLRFGQQACELKTYIISRAPDWQRLQADAQVLLDALALVPLDRHTSETTRENDLYAFAVVGAATGEHVPNDEVPRGDAEAYWLHVLPLAWRRMHGHAPLGPVILKSESAGVISVELGGRDHAGLPTLIGAELTSGARIEVPNSMVALSYVSSKRRPEDRLGIHLPARRLTHVIGHRDWHDVSLHGWGVILLGWMSRLEFRSRAQLLPAGAKVLQFDRTRIKNLGVPFSELRPLDQLGRPFRSAPAP